MKKTGKKGKLIFQDKVFSLVEYSDKMIDVKKILEVKGFRVKTDMEEIPSLLQFFGTLQAKALRQFKMADTNYRVWKAKKGKELRNKKIDGKALTESQRDNWLTSDPEFMEMKEKIHRAEEKYEIIKSVYWAIQAKAGILEELHKQTMKVNSLNNKKDEEEEEDDDRPF